MFILLMAKPRHSLEAIASINENPGLLLVLCIFTFTGGAAMVIGHNTWSEGALPVALLGWVTMLKGAALIAVPPHKLTAFYRVLHYPARFTIDMGVGAVFSAWLTATAFLA